MQKVFKRFANFGAAGVLAIAVGAAGLAIGSAHASTPGTKTVRMSSDDRTGSPSPQPTTTVAPATTAVAAAPAPAPMATALPDSDDQAGVEDEGTETAAEEAAEGPGQANDADDASGPAPSATSSPLIDDSGNDSSGHDSSGRHGRDDGPGHN
jgi:hypothetical protein